MSIVTGILETEPVLTEGRAWLFTGLEVVFIVVFGVEYAARLFAAPCNPRFGSALRYALTPASLLDLFVLATLITPFLGLEATLLRLVRALRLLRLARLGRFSMAMAMIGEAIASRKFELGISLLFAVCLLIASSTALYFVEGGIQPEAFGSIPRAMWWSVATLTTVGYGDQVPVTGAGKVFAALTALTGIGVIAIPTGILAGAFAEALRKARERGRQ